MVPQAETTRCWEGTETIYSSVRVVTTGWRGDPATIKTSSKDFPSQQVLGVLLDRLAEPLTIDWTGSLEATLHRKPETHAAGLWLRDALSDLEHLERGLGVNGEIRVRIPS